MTGKEIGFSVLPLLGTGRTAEIYALDKKLALKLYHRQIPRENAIRNYRLLQASGEAGVPVPAVYEMVESGGRDGMIMERVEGKPFDALAGGAGFSERNRLTDRFADCVRRAHQVRVEKERLKELLPDQKAFSFELADAMIGAGFTKDRIEWKDVLIRRADEKAIMLFRSLGKAFYPVLAGGEDEKYNIAILSKLPDSAEYEYTIGMNTIRLVFNLGGKEVQSE